MRHTQFSQLKNDVYELLDFGDREELLTLLKAALSSEDAKQLCSDDTKDYFYVVQSLFIFLQELSSLFGFDETIFPDEFKGRAEFVDYKFKAATNEQVIEILTALFDKVPARKLVWDLNGVFTTALTNKEFLKDTFMLSGISFHLKLISQFMRDYEFTASFNLQEKICTNIKDYTPINN